MTNEMNAFELTDEQLETVAGGGTGNSSIQYVAVDNSTTNAALFARDVTQYGGIATTNVQSFQSATDSHNTSTKTWANILSFND